MHIKSFRYYLLCLLVIILPLSGCGPKYKAAKDQRQLEKRMAQRRTEGDRAMTQARQRHQHVQSPQTRQRMKETRRKSNRLLNNKRSKPFYERWYDKVRNRRN